MYQGFSSVDIPAAKDKICPFPGKQQRSRFSHTTGSAGNDERFIFKLQ